MDHELNRQSANFDGVIQHRTPCRTVLMVGTDADGQGGIAAVVRAYMNCDNFFQALRVTYVASHRSGSNSRKLLSAVNGWLSVLWNLIRLDAPLVHIHLSSRNSFWRKYVVCGLVRIFRQPYILHVHGSEFEHFYQNECNGTAKALVRHTFRKAALILALSSEWKVRLHRICPDAKVEILPNAVPVPELAGNEYAELDEHTILFMGRLGKRKGTYELIQAFANIAAKFPAARLICAGDGEIQLLKDLAARLGVTDRVELPGWLSSQQCQAKMKSASIFALPSHAEGLPIALLEAMSWRLAVISCPVGGIPQLIRNEQNGLLVEPGNVTELTEALTCLLTDSRLRTRLAQSARATIESEYSLEAHMEHLAKIYSRFGVSKQDDFRP